MKDGTTHLAYKPEHAVDLDTGVYPASLTKMMTLYLLFEAIDSGKLGLNSRLQSTVRYLIYQKRPISVKNSLL